MLGFRDNKEMVKRPENERKFSLKNKLDRKIFFISLAFIGVLLVLLALFITLYYLQ